MPIEALVHSVADALLPPRELTVSEWADTNRQMSSEASAERGQWRTDRAPYQREILDCLSQNSPYQFTVLMSSAQIGKTEMQLNLLGFIISEDPGPTLVVVPRGEDAKRFSKKRLAPMLRDTPCLRGKVSEVRSRNSDNTVLDKSFIGGHVAITGSHSPAGLSALPIRYALLDEVDRFPASAGTEGDPAYLAYKRTTTFWNRRVMMCSTPTTKGVSRIETAYLSSDQRRFHVPCPLCGEYQTLEWNQVEWPDGQPLEAHYRCVHCQELIPHHRKPWMLKQGYWEKGNAASKIAGFHISQLYSPWRTWGETAEEYELAKDNPETLRAWTNTALGLPWDDEKATSVDLQTLMARREFYGPAVSAEVAVLTAGIDVQGDRVEVEIVGWGAKEESWSVAYQVIPGDPEGPGLWNEVDAYLERAWPHPLAGSLHIAATAIDSGYATQSVYDYCRQRYHLRRFAVKGRFGNFPVWPQKPTRKKGMPLYLVGVDSAKSVVYARLKIDQAGPGYSHVPADRSEEWFAQLLSEMLTTRYSKGKAIREWVRKKGLRAEALDCRVYAYAALQGLVSMGLSLDAECARVATLVPPEIVQPKAAPRVVRSSWMQA